MSLEFFEGFELSNRIADYLDKFTAVVGLVTGLGGSTYCISPGINNFNLSNLTEFVLGFRFKLSGNNSIFYLKDGTTVQLTLSRNAISSRLEIYSGNLGTLLGTGTHALTSGVEYYIEIKAKIDNSTGYTIIHINEVEDINVSGVDTQISANNYINNITLYDGYYDDVYVASVDATTPNDFIGDVKVIKGVINANGNYTDYTPSAGSLYQCVDEIPPNDDTDYVSDNTLNNKVSFGFAALGVTGTVYGVEETAFVRKDDAGAISVALLAYVNSTDYLGSTVSLSQTYTYIRKLRPKSPATGVNWTVTEINSSKFGLKTVSVG